MVHSRLRDGLRRLHGHIVRLDDGARWQRDVSGIDKLEQADFFHGAHSRLGVLHAWHLHQDPVSTDGLYHRLFDAKAIRPIPHDAQRRFHGLGIHGLALGQIRLEEHLRPFLQIEPKLQPDLTRDRLVTQLDVDPRVTGPCHPCCQGRDDCDQDEQTHVMLPHETLLVSVPARANKSTLVGASPKGRNVQAGESSRHRHAL